MGIILPNAASVRIGGSQTLNDIELPNQIEAVKNERRLVFERVGEG